MGATFSAAAGPQALGYLYQTQYALHSLLAADSEETAIIVEGLDDVELQATSSTKLQQLKHHISTKRQATLTNSSTDLWKTLRVWADLLQKKAWNPLQTKLALITTATAGKKSIPSLLRDDKVRDPDEALKQLVTLAATPPSKALAEPFKVFNSLTALQKKQLVQSIVVIDQAPDIEDLEVPIKKQLQFSAPANKVDNVYLHLLGWWYSKVAQQLNEKSHAPIRLIDLKNKLDEIRNQHQRDSLPIEFARASPDKAFYDAQEGRLFVRQLDYLILHTDRVRFAITDYYRAFQQRTKWATDGLLFDEELLHYEEDLKENWARYVARLKSHADFDGKLEEDAVCRTFGLSVLDWMETVNFSIRAGMPAKDEYVTRGSYHMLADEPTPAVYWHPKCLEKLTEALEQATA